MSVAAVQIEKTHYNARAGVITSPDKENIKTKYMEFPAIIPYVRTAGEFELLNEGHLIAQEEVSHLRGISIPTIFAKKILDDHRFASLQKNLSEERPHNAYNFLSDKAIFFDHGTDAIYYNAEWPNHRTFLQTIPGIDGFVKSIDESFVGQKRGCDVDKQSHAWASLVNDDRLRHDFVKRFFQQESMYNGMYLSAPTPMIHRDVSSSVDMAAIIAKKSEIIAKGWEKPYLLSLTLNGTALRSTRFMNDFLKQLMEENRFGNQFEGIAFKFVNEEVHQSSASRNNFSKLLDVCIELRKNNKVTMMHNLDIALGMVAVSRGIDIVTSPMCGNTRVKFAPMKSGRGFSNNFGSWISPHTLEPLRFDDVEDFLRETGGVFPHNCPACQELSGKDIRKKVGQLKYNRERKKHTAYFMGELCSELKKAIKDESMTAGVQDWINRSNYQNYFSLIRNGRGSF